MLRILLVALVFISFQAHADRNLSVDQQDAAVSERRVALVIGNSAYTNSPLKNPVNDARDVARKLRKLGFEVIERNNLKIKQIGSTLREFRSKLAPGAVALVFYAGHGLQIKGVNYLPAVDADINFEEDVHNQSLAVRQIMDVLDESRTRLNLVFLDACRNNPYARSFRSAEQGLARVVAPSGTLISYATRPGSIAADGDGRNGLYTSKLLAQMDSNLQIEQVLKRVVASVKAASQGKQEPWMEGSIEGNFCFAGCANNGGNVTSAIVDAEPASQQDSNEIELIYWKSIMESQDPEDFREFLARYPDGELAPAARSKLKQITEQQQAALEEARQPPSASGHCPNGFAGNWQTSYGRLTIRVDGNMANGNYDYGTINGKITGHTLNGSWNEPSGFYAGTGDLQFELSSDGGRFSGTWTRSTGFGNSGGAWNGTCQP